MRRLLVVFGALWFSVGSLLAAQIPGTQPLPVWGEVFVGSELESYLRDLQLLGEVRLYPWSIRSFSQREVGKLAPGDTTLPWARRYAFDARGGARVALLRPGVTVRWNSGFPFGPNAGAVWAGRGLTGAIDAGVAAAYGPVSATVAPLAFQAENAPFRLMPTGYTGPLAFGEPFFPGIDLPQRFGDRPYGMVDPGQSTVRVDWVGLVAGFSTANVYWGPAREFPIMLGNNAAGFPHAFVGTSAPANLGVVRLHARILWGKLYQSAYDGDTAAGGLRFASGALVVLTSSYIPGLEVGVTRFDHRQWPEGGLSFNDLLVPFQNQFAGNAALQVKDNQLASAFFRWVLPRSGFEIYGEYGRDDWNQNLRDFVEEPDHIGGYTVGLAKAFRLGPIIRVFRFEVQNLQYSVLAQGRGWAPFYTNGSIPQGHTNRGKLLGSYAGLGGAGALAAFDIYHPGGRWTFSWSRVLRRQRGGFATTGQPDPKGLDVVHTLGANALLFRGRYDITAGLTAVYEFNRDFGNDAFDLNATLGMRLGWK